VVNTYIDNGDRMPKISMWNPRKSNNYYFIDKQVRDSIYAGGVGVIIHKYIGSSEDGDISDIDDVLFLENRERHYDTHVYEGRCVYTPQDVDYDLSQFGIFLSSDVMRFDFHFNDMIDTIGRKLVSGDVLEFPNMRDTTISGETLNRFYVVQDALYSANGYSQTWRPHMWKVKGKQLQESTEYKDVLEKSATGHSAGGMGEGLGLMPPGFSEMVDANGETGPGYDPQLANTLGMYCKHLGITDEIIKEAEEDVYFDPKFMVTPHLYVCLDEDGYPGLQYWRSGDGVPPNGGKLRGMGNKFPDDMKDGEYFLRLDYAPDRLFQKQGKRYVKIEDDIRKAWTAYNKVLDTFIDNTNVTTLEDGSTVPEKQALHDILSPKVDLYKDKKIELEKQKKEKDDNNGGC
jgi:hypothetical protein